ncbi:DUF6496 domain-containing protein [Danxiaibacter flavus]|uniref:DUF6496 domain-containing protein n=2 Tax=Danxiaibacter flavus TaxID=3049108 RepID=A0ABV3Z7Z5_9BACT|nr:DUF6496 domain-containing protein [Chitinophagaceae bacterium DXS]
MAKYSAKSQKKVEKSMHEMKEGKLKSGRSGRKVTNPKQAIAIGLSEAREEGAKVPKKAASKTAKKAAPRKTAKRAAPKKAAKRAAPKKAAKRSAPKKAARRKSASKKS